MPLSLVERLVVKTGHDYSRLRAFPEMLLVPAGGDVRLGTAGALETAKVTRLSV